MMEFTLRLPLMRKDLRYDTKPDANVGLRVILDCLLLY